MVRKPLANGLQTKCAYVWTRLRTCAAPSAKSWHTIHHKPKFVRFLREHKENWMGLVSFPCTGSPLLASSWQKINKPCAAYVPYVNYAVRKRRACVYKVLEYYHTRDTGGSHMCRKHSFCVYTKAAQLPNSKNS